MNSQNNSQMGQTGTSFHQLSDEEFKQKLASKFYRSTYHQIGELKPIVENEKKFGNNGRFTDHLLASGMPKNASLNTTCERQRVVEGSKDWMEHLS